MKMRKILTACSKDPDYDIKSFNLYKNTKYIMQSGFRAGWCWFEVWEIVDESK